MSMRVGDHLQTEHDVPDQASTQLQQDRRLAQHGFARSATHMLGCSQSTQDQHRVLHLCIRQELQALRQKCANLEASRVESQAGRDLLSLGRLFVRDAVNSFDEGQNLKVRMKGMGGRLRTTRRERKGGGGQVGPIICSSFPASGELSQSNRQG